MEATKDISTHEILLAIDLVIERFDDNADIMLQKLRTTFAQAFNDQAMSSRALIQGINGHIEPLKLEVYKDPENNTDRGFAFFCVAVVDLKSCRQDFSKECQRIESNWKEIVASRFVRMETLTQGYSLEIIKNKTHAYIGGA